MSRSRYLSMALCLIMLIVCVSSCGSKASAADAGNGKLSIVCTVFPEYDWVRQITGTNTGSAEITYLLESGIDLHNFRPTADDIIKISQCDLFIYVGGESDTWTKDALDGALNKNMKVINLLETVGENAKLEEVKEGMQAEDEEEDDDSEEEEEDEYDEHVWLSIKNAKLICQKISDTLCEIDPENSESYKNNLTAYFSELDALDKDFRTVSEAAKIKTMIFGDRFPFRYFADDYGIDYFAAFSGCSAETEASFETVIFLADKLNELGCKTIYIIENSDSSIAQTVINSTEKKDQKIAVLNSVQSVSREQIEGGATYISIMRGNYDILKETLE